LDLKEADSRHNEYLEMGWAIFEHILRKEVPSKVTGSLFRYILNRILNEGEGYDE